MSGSRDRAGKKAEVENEKSGKPEKPLAKKEVEKFRFLLQRRLTEAQKVYRQEIGNVKGADYSDQASQECDLSEQIRAKDKARKEIFEIQAALERMDKEEFGICEDCDEQIPRKRLESSPTAKFCITCKIANELAEKRLGYGRTTIVESEI